MNIATTYLFVPGNRHERFDKAVAAGADVTVFDLEDAVHPNGKDAARVAIASWLAARQLSGQVANVLVRINDTASPYFNADLEWLATLPAGTPLAGLMVPKAEQPATLGGIAEALRRINPHGVLVAIIESAIGLHQADAIATAPGVARLAFGSIDYAVDLGCEHTRDALAYARSRLVLASRVARLPPPVDGVTTALTDETVLADDVAYARELGFAGKLCIHPSQVAGVQAGFRPSPQQADWARRVIEATSSGSHAVQVDGKMVDRPVIEQAKRILALSGN